MTTIEVIANAIRNGLDNSQIILDAHSKNISFNEYIGAISSTGKHRINDNTIPGFYIYGEENFISIPDTIFVTEYEKVAFYELSN